MIKLSFFTITFVLFHFLASSGLVVFAEARDKTVTAEVEFRVIGAQENQIGAMVPNARILIVDNKGNLLRSGLTNKDGIWRVLITTEIDPRFTMVEKMSTVTAITIANGFNEAIIFDVPVKSDAVQVIVLSPLKRNSRNEPTYSLGMLHRLTVIPLIDTYAKQAGLIRVNSIEGDPDSPHWSPTFGKP
ncbi:hypothetical protein ACQCN2_06215 [Brevibacillus ginsengisoli]|uniref:hypothetical protein n=1 Tax=Brevibacillus ginsengisoli TaxID=363854 RepID=UPI003CF7F389